MCSPLHIRPGVYLLSLFAVPAVIFIGVSGCASIPELSDPAQHDFVDRSWDEIPVPDFDNSQRTRVAGTDTDGILVREPEAFEWQRVGRSEFGRSIDAVTIGTGEYRVLIVGSIAGDDPSAIHLTEELARHLHENSIIFGGAETTVIRTLNPDVESLQSSFNNSRQPMNRSFPTSSDARVSEESQRPEVRFLLKYLKDNAPDRVIHIRSYPRGVVAASSGAAAAAKDLAEWHEMTFIALPGKSRDGTLERYLASSHSSPDILTFAFPETVEKDSLWDTYGDGLLNLLLDEDFETRKLAREQSKKRSQRNFNRKW